MDVDPIQLIIASKPRPGDVATAGEGVVATQGETRRASNFQGFDLNELSAVPGSPGYAQKMDGIRKQVIALGDPEEIRALQEQPAVVQDAPPLPVQPAALNPATPTRRIAIYYGKHNADLSLTYNVAVESAPDWDTDFLFRGRCGEDVGLLIDLAKALGVKVSDKTGEF